MKIETFVEVTIIAKLPEDVIQEIKELQHEHGLDDEEFLIQATKSLALTMQRRATAENARAAKAAKKPKRTYKKKEKNNARSTV